VRYLRAGHPAERRYTELTVIFTGTRPPVYTGPDTVTHPQTQTFKAS
jgi:hypothetical protein